MGDDLQSQKGFRFNFCKIFQVEMFLRWTKISRKRMTVADNKAILQKNSSTSTVTFCEIKNSITC